MINENWAYVAAAINVAGTSTYIWDVLRGRAQPNRMTWLVLTFAPMIAFASMLSQGVEIRQALFTFIVGFNPLLIFLSTFLTKHPAWKLQRFDIVCGTLSILGLVLWRLTGEGNIAILFSVLADGLAFLPTLIKGYKHPDSESSTAFMIGVIASVIALATITRYDFKHLAFPLYILAADSLMCVFLYLKPGSRSSTAEDKL